VTLGHCDGYCEKSYPTPSLLEMTWFPMCEGMTMYPSDVAAAYGVCLSDPT